MVINAAELSIAVTRFKRSGKRIVINQNELGLFRTQIVCCAVLGVPCRQVGQSDQFVGFNMNT
jgi:hypothetical protein